MWVVAALYNLGFAAFHLTFWRLLGWRRQLPRLSRDTGGVLQISTLCLTLVLLFFAYILTVHPRELSTTPLGRDVLGGVTAFWLARTVEQTVFMDLRRRFHRVLLLVFALGTALHAALLKLWALG